MLVLTVKAISQTARPSVINLTATDWFTGGWLKCCLMYSRIPLGILP